MSEHDRATDHIEVRRQRNLRNITRMYYGSARLIGYGCIASVVTAFVTFGWGLQSLMILFYLSLVGRLLGDDGRPLLREPGNLGLPVHVFIVNLPDFFDAFHELREGFELRPLVIGCAYRNVDVNGLFKLCHVV